MNRDNLPFTRHAANEYEGLQRITMCSVRRFGKDFEQVILNRFRLSHKPMGLVLIERVTV